MSIIKPQFIALSISLWFVIVSAVVIGDFGNKNSHSEGIDLVPISNSNNIKLEVRSAVGSPGSTSNLIQGSKSLQSETGSVEQPSTNLLNLLQPNSGRSSFTDQDELPQ